MLQPGKASPPSPVSRDSGNSRNDNDDDDVDASPMCRGTPAQEPLYDVPLAQRGTMSAKNMVLEHDKRTGTLVLDRAEESDVVTMPELSNNVDFYSPLAPRPGSQPRRTAGAEGSTAEDGDASGMPGDGRAPARHVYCTLVSKMDRVAVKRVIAADARRVTGLELHDLRIHTSMKHTNTP